MKEFKNELCRLAFEAYDKIPTSIIPKDEWTCFSAFFVEREDSGIKCVSLAVGCKSLPSHVLSKDGSLLGDMHAEILAHRALCRYLIRNRSLFQEKNWKIHMFISHYPCGGGTIPVYDKKESKVARFDDKIYTGAKPIISNGTRENFNNQDYTLPRRKPGKGEPSLNMSCTDKIIKWIICGLQSSLVSTLSEFNHYIPLNSITVIDPMNNEPTYLETLVKERLIMYQNSYPEAFSVSRVPSIRIFNKEDLSTAFRLQVDKSSKKKFEAIIWSNENDCHDRKTYEVIVKGFKQGCSKKDLKKSGRSLYCRCLMLHELNDSCDSSMKFDIPENLIGQEYTELKNRLLSKLNEEFQNRKKLFFEKTRWIRGSDYNDFIMNGGTISKDKYQT